MKTSVEKRVKVALVVPNNAVKFGDFAPPLNLGYIASYLHQQLPEVEIKIFDGTITSDVYELRVDYDADLVGVTATTPQIKGAYALLDRIKAHYHSRHLLNLPAKKVLTVIGGVHASALSDEASNHADVVVVGEGEVAFTTIVSLYASGEEIPKIVYGTPAEKLDDLPSPDYEMLHLENYIERRIDYIKELNQYPLMRMMTSRGCNYRCPFCHNSKRQVPVRYLSAEKIIKEIEWLVARYGIKSIWFQDDEFLANKKRFKRFVELLKSSGLEGKFTWACQARVDSIDPETLSLARSIGCVVVFLGIETVNKSLNYLKCGTITKQDVENALTIGSQVGVDLFGSFIVGSPNETLEDMQETWDWILSHRRKGLSNLSFGILTPYPGSKVFDTALAEGVFTLDNVDYDKIKGTDAHTAYLVDKAITADELASFLKDKNRWIWLGTQAQKKKLWQIAMHKTFWWAILKCPRDFLRLFGKR